MKEQGKVAVIRDGSYKSRRNLDCGGVAMLPGTRSEPYARDFLADENVSGSARAADSRQAGPAVHRPIVPPDESGRGIVRGSGFEYTPDPHGGTFIKYTGRKDLFVMLGVAPGGRDAQRPIDASEILPGDRDASLRKQ